MLANFWPWLVPRGTRSSFCKGWRLAWHMPTWPDERDYVHLGYLGVTHKVNLLQGEIMGARMDQRPARVHSAEVGKWSPQKGCWTGRPWLSCKPFFSCELPLDFLELSVLPSWNVHEVHPVRPEARGSPWQAPSQAQTRTRHVRHLRGFAVRILAVQLSIARRPKLGYSEECESRGGNKPSVSGATSRQPRDAHAT
jgi:hypothetical protein